MLHTGFMGDIIFSQAEGAEHSVPKEIWLAFGSIVVKLYLNGEGAAPWGQKNGYNVGGAFKTKIWGGV